MSYKYGGVLLGVLINKEQDERLFGNHHGAVGLLESYSTHLLEKYGEEGPKSPSFAQKATQDYIGFFVLVAGPELVMHYVERGLLTDDKPQAVELPDKDEVMDWRRGLHFVGLMKDALTHWHHFAEFCAQNGLELSSPKLYLVVDEE